MCVFQDDKNQETMNKFSMRYDDVETATVSQHKLTTSPIAAQTNTVKLGRKFTSVPKPPPLIDRQLFSTNPVPPTAFLLAAAASGGSIW